MFNTNGTISITPAPGDFVSGVEGVVGSAGNDTIIGNAANNGFAGGPGDDTLAGNAGNDCVIGGRGQRHPERERRLAGGRWVACLGRYR